MYPILNLLEFYPFRLTTLTPRSSTVSLLFSLQVSKFLLHFSFEFLFSSSGCSGNSLIFNGCYRFWVKRTRMTTTQLTASTISGKGFALFEGLRSSNTVKIASFAPFRRNISRSFPALVVKAATTITPKVYSYCSKLI